MPKTLSVVVPTYNRRELLPRVIMSLLQDDATREVVVVVDGSQDGSAELMTQLAAENPRLMPIITKTLGVDRARRTGVEAATGDVVLPGEDHQRLISILSATDPQGNLDLRRTVADSILRQ